MSEGTHQCKPVAAITSNFWQLLATPNQQIWLDRLTARVNVPLGLTAVCHYDRMRSDMV